MRLSFKNISEYDAIMQGLPTSRVSKITGDEGKFVGKAVLYNNENGVFDGMGKEVALQVVTDKYYHVDNPEIMERYRPVAQDYIDKGGKGWVIEHRGYLRLALLEPERDERFQLGLMVANSVASSSSVKVEPIVQRIVCSNGATVRFVRDAVAIRHLTSKKEDIEKLLNSGKKMEGIMSEYVRKYDNLANHTDPELVKNWLDSLADKKILSEHWIEKTYHEKEQQEPIKTVKDVYDAITFRGSHTGQHDYNFSIIAAAEQIIRNPTKIPAR